MCVCNSGWYQLAENWTYPAPQKRSLCLGTSFVMRLKPLTAREEHSEDVYRVWLKKISEFSEKIKISKNQKNIEEKIIEHFSHRIMPLN